MKELTIDEVKEIELNLLIKFDNLCKANDWRYSMGGGTLIGAVRHKGFIPWDDDIDVLMPRPDYDAMINNSNEQEYEFNVINYETTEGFNMPFCKISDPNTIIEDEAIDLSDYKLGVHIDVFPIDGLGNTYEDAVKQYNRTTFQRELLNARTWKKFFRSKTHSIWIEPIRLGMFLISRFVSSKALLTAIDKENRKVMFDEAEYCCCNCGAYRQKEIFPRKIYNEFCDMEFEDKVFRGFTNYVIYLTQIFGDYMKLPPVEKQVSHHTFKAYHV